VARIDLDKKSDRHRWPERLLSVGVVTYLHLQYLHLWFRIQ
jgi:hypothetical protein